MGGIKNEFANEEAYRCLTNEEKQSLVLSVGYGRTSWEVGEMMGITHYKYLELKERAEKFFKLFYDYFSSYHSLIRPNSGLDERFQYFIEGCIEKRLRRRAAALYTGDSSLSVNTINRKIIFGGIEKLRSSENEHDIDLYKLIMEFDRWNNWRILPRELQQPSAYKRRNNRRDIYYIKYVCSLHRDRVDILERKFKYKGYKHGNFFCTFHEEVFDEGYKVIKTGISDENLEKLTKLFIYVFDNKEDADSYGFLVTRFQYESKTSTKGQTFWPEYRSIIEKAINYKQINNTEFYCDEMDKAYGITRKGNKRDASTEKRKHKKALKKSAKSNPKRAKDSEFYM